MKPFVDVAALTAALAVAGLAHAAAPPKGIDRVRAEEIIVTQTNAFRREHGLHSLEREERLDETAADFAVFMARTDDFAHTAGGLKPQDRALRHGYKYCVILENIGYQSRSVGFETSELAHGFVDGWTHSPLHKKNMLDRDATQIGVGIARSPTTGRFYGVQLFGRPESASIVFDVVNESRATIGYSTGGREFTIVPRSMMTHRGCGFHEVAFHRTGERLSFEPKGGERFVVREDDGRLKIHQEAR